MALRVGLYTLLFDVLAPADVALGNASSALAVLAILGFVALPRCSCTATTRSSSTTSACSKASGAACEWCAGRSGHCPVVAVAYLVLAPLVQAAFSGGFDDTRYVFPPYLLAYLLVLAVEQYAVDVALITIYSAVPQAMRRGPR